MMFHAAFIQQHPAGEQIAQINRTRVGRERRAGQREAAPQGRNQRVRHRADITLIGAVERRTVLEEILPTAAACSHFNAARDSSTAWRTGAVRDFSATTTASASGIVVSADGTPIS